MVTLWEVPHENMIVILQNDITFNLKYCHIINETENVKRNSKIVKVVIRPSRNRRKRWRSIFYDNLSDDQSYPFRIAGMSDYTKNKDKERKQRYLNRHRKRENWNDFTSAGSLCSWILWGEPMYRASIQQYKQRFHLIWYNRMGMFSFSTVNLVVEMNIPFC